MYGETAPESWGLAELRVRLRELLSEEMPENEASSAPKGNKTPLEQAITQVNKASRKKDTLKELASKEYGIALTGNETIAQLQTRRSTTSTTRWSRAAGTRLDSVVMRK